jgi:nitroreductase
LTVEGAAREQMGELLAEAAKLQDGEVTEAAIDKARNGPLRAPLVVVVIARVQDHVKYPKSEQLLAAGCAAHGILLAAYAQGIGAVWRTGDLAYSAHVAKGLGAGGRGRGDCVPVPRHAAERTAGGGEG